MQLTSQRRELGGKAGRRVAEPGRQKLEALLGRHLRRFFLLQLRQDEQKPVRVAQLEPVYEVRQEDVGCQNLSS